MRSQSSLACAKPRGTCRLALLVSALGIGASACPALVTDRYNTKEGSAGAEAGTPTVLLGGLGGGETGSSGGAGGETPLGGSSPIVGGSSPIVGGSSPIVGGSSPIVGGSSPIVGGSATGAGAPSAGVAGSVGTGGSGGGPLVPEGFAYRRTLSIEAGATSVPEGYTVCLALDHSALVGAAKSRADGSDVRVFRATAAGLEELDRALAPDTGWNQRRTEVCFATRAPIPASQADTSYTLYYGSYSAGEPPGDAHRVFLVWEDFDDGVLDGGWTLAQVGAAAGSLVEADGSAVITGTTGNIWDTADDFLFLERQQSGGIRVEACIAASGGAQSSIAKLGGAMVRQSLTRGSPHRAIVAVQGTQSRVTHYRLSADAATEAAIATGSNPLPECYALTRFGDWSRTFYKKESAATWTELGLETRFASPLADPVHVGIPFANVMQTEGWVSASWLTITKYVAPEPEVRLGREGTP